jgi:hypothetical protein
VKQISGMVAAGETGAALDRDSDMQAGGGGETRLVGGSDGGAMAASAVPTSLPGTMCAARTPLPSAMATARSPSPVRWPLRRPPSSAQRPVL